MKFDLKTVITLVMILASILGSYFTLKGNVNAALEKVDGIKVEVKELDNKQRDIELDVRGFSTQQTAIQNDVKEIKGLLRKSLGME